MLLLLGVALAWEDRAEELGAAVSGAKEGGMAWLDVNADGWLDVLITRQDQGMVLLVNDAGVFEDRTSDLAPALAGTSSATSVAAGDVDNDGYPDVVVVLSDRVDVWLNAGPSGDTPFQLGRNADRNTPDRRHRVTELGRASSVAFRSAGLADVDSDGWLDLVVVLRDSGAHLLRNNGGTFRPVSTGLPFNSDAGDNLALGDIDDDGDVDVLARMVGVLPLFHNDGAGNLSFNRYVRLHTEAANPGGVLLCDLDEDGDQDIYWGAGGVDSSSGGPVNRIFEWQGGVVAATTEPRIGSASEDISGMTCGDVDNDGHPDLFIAGPSSGYLFRNRTVEVGEWSFAAIDGPWADPGSEQADGALVDVDHDGDLDLMVSRDGESALYVNDLGGDSLTVRVLRGVWGTCVAPLAYRDDLGARVQREDQNGIPVSGAWNLGMAGGYGSQQPPLVHLGLPEGPDEATVVNVRFTTGERVGVPITPSELGAWRVLEVRDDDWDADGVLNEDELALGGDTDQDGREAWLDRDSDGDSIPDAVEAGDAVPCGEPLDTDGDGKPDMLDYDADDDGRQDATEGTADDDGDGVPNWRDPDDTDGPDYDSDGDGLSNLKESEYGTDPLNPDTDGDGLSDGEEVEVYGTDPLQADTDGGGVGDGDEVARGTDPLDPSDDLDDPEAVFGLAGGLKGWGRSCGSAPGAASPLLALLALAVARRRRR